MKKRKLKIINFLYLTDEKYNKIREYRNQKFVREVSLTSDTISEDSHMIYKELLEKEEKYFAFLIICEDIDYSVITLKKINEYTCLVGDYLVKEEFKYEGGGVVNSVCMNYILTQLNIKYIKANQKVDNVRGNRSSIVETLEVTTSIDGGFNEYLSAVPSFYDKGYLKSKPKKLFDKLYEIDKCEGLVIDIKRSNIIGRVKRFKNFYFGYAYDLDNLSKEQKVDMYIDDKLEITLDANLDIDFFLMAEDSKVQKHRFFIEIPEKIFDNNIHTISFREHKKNNSLLNSTFNDIYLENEKVDGDVWSINKTSYVGWCKKVNSFDSQNIDVYIDNKFIETILARGFSFYLHSVYKSHNKLGFIYTMPRKFFDDKNHIISFVPQNQKNKLGEEDIIFCIQEGERITQSDIAKNGNIIEGYFYDLNNLSDSKQLDMYFDDQFERTLKVNMELPNYLKIDGTLSQKHRFMFELPKKIFDNKVHTITFKEFDTEKCINNIKTSVYLKNEVINGDVWRINDFEFEGWCKQIDSLNSQNIDIYINREYIETIVTNIESPYLSQLFGSNNKFGFIYKISEKYLNYKNLIISFCPEGLKNTLGLSYFEISTT